MSAAKRAVRDRLRAAALRRDNHRCAVCPPGVPTLEAPPVTLDCHHITPRELMPFGGYVLENVITLRGPCHLKAEAALKLDPDFHKRAESGADAELDDYMPDTLYDVIGSSRAEAEAAARSL